ncbi:MAG TPA: DUF475 domain-containing protein [Defluviicoccus sp.]|nr:DUF475 domain-containing protein [Defluviicoccus sp.]
MRTFALSILVTVVCLALAYLWQDWRGVYIAVVLGILEISLSFDNAVVNASVLDEMDPLWQTIFLTAGILIAVFGMRLIFPVAIVAGATGLGAAEVAHMALNHPEEYSRHLHESHTEVACFGGTFLLLVFLGFLIDNGKEVHWLGQVEALLARLGKLESAAVLCALVALIGLQSFLPEEERIRAVLAGLLGIMIFIAVDGIDAFFQSGGDGHGGVAKRSGVAGFLYLELLDASFSFDGVIGAFAITNDVVLIMLGLGIGAVFVRSFTVFMVRQGTLKAFVFLEHGAHYAIGLLAAVMLASPLMAIPEWISGGVGVLMIGLSLVSSVRYNRLQRQASG